MLIRAALLLLLSINVAESWQKFYQFREERFRLSANNVNIYFGVEAKTEQQKRNEENADPTSLGSSLQQSLENV
jgi:hypothetical protein